MKAKSAKRQGQEVDKNLKLIEKAVFELKEKGSCGIEINFLVDSKLQ